MKVKNCEIVKIKFLRTDINNYNNVSSDYQIIKFQFLFSNINNYYN